MARSSLSAWHQCPAPRGLDPAGSLARTMAAAASLAFAASAGAKQAAASQGAAPTTRLIIPAAAAARTVARTRATTERSVHLLGKPIGADELSRRRQQLLSWEMTTTSLLFVEAPVLAFG